MKLTVLLTLFACLQIKASVYSQQVSLSVKKASLEKIIKQIRKQTGYAFFYDAAYLQHAKPVSVDIHNVSIKDALTKVFEGQKFTWEVQDNTILIKPSVKESKKVAVVAQTTIDIKGKIVDEKGEPLPGASVSVKGTTKGTGADAEGNFVLESVDPQATLVVSNTGYNTTEIVIQNRKEITITLVATLKDLDEVIVVGYGTIKKKNFTGSVGSLKLEDSPIAMAPNLNALESLKGSISGMNIGATNSSGGEPSMLIRGQNSINGNNNPLIVLDGVIFMGNLSDINTSDIASFDVLKDAVSAAAYGSRAANGIISITTKRGKSEKPVINFTSSIGAQVWQNRPTMMGGAQWLQTVIDRSGYAQGSTSFLTNDQLENYNNGVETNWLDETSKTGFINANQVAVSGSSNKLNYYLSTAYDENKGVIKGDDFNRISLLGKLDMTITSWLKVGVNAGFTKRDYSGGGANLYFAYKLPPYSVMYRDGEGNLEKYPSTGGATNPLWGVYDGTRDNMDIRNNLRLNTYAVVNVPWIKGLSYRLNYLPNMDRIESGNFYHEDYFVAEGEGPERYEPAVLTNYLASANGSRKSEQTYSYVWDNILSYTNTFGKHSIDATLVATRDLTKYEYRTISGSNFAANGNTSLGLSGLDYATVQKIDMDGTKQTNIGYLGRVNYGYDSKYYLTASLRRDGASVFGANKKWGNFAAVGLAYRITEEDFMQSIKSKFLDDLKINLSWGQNGNQGVDPYTTLSKIANGSSGGYRYEFSDNPSEILYGLTQSSIGNSVLGWESTSAVNFGFESLLLKGRIGLNVDAYFSKTTDQIFDRNIPVMTGFKTIKTSMGQVNNRGIEITLRTENFKRTDFSWTSEIIFWKNSNKLVKLYGEDLDGDGVEDDDISNSLFIGKSLGAIYGYEQEGIVQEGDTEYMSLTGASAGDPKYVDHDGVAGITANDRVVLGYSKENFRLNFSNTLRYKNLQLYMMITGTFGGNNRYMQSNTYAYLTSGTGVVGDNMSYKPYWTVENPSNIYPSAAFAGDGRFLGLQSRGFVRFQDVTLSYNIKQNWLKNINAFKVFLAAKNIATITNWEGTDPETGAGYLSSSYPVVSTYSLGVNLSF